MHNEIAFTVWKSLIKVRYGLAQARYEGTIVGLDINSYSLPQKGRMVNNMEEKKKIIVVAKVGGIEIVVEGEKR